MSSIVLVHGLFQSVPTGAEQPVQGMADDVAPGAPVVLSTDQAVADEQRERKKTARLGVVVVDADLPEECAQVGHPPVVYAVESLTDAWAAAGPVADRQLDRKPGVRPGVIARQIEQVPQLRT